MFVTLAKCRHPTEQVDDAVRVIGFTEPAVRGTNVTLTCPPGLVLTGPDNLTCMGNGEWEPDPKDVECNSENMIRITEDSFEALNRCERIAVASSVTVFVVTSILFVIVGFLCGHFCRKGRKTTETLPPSVQTQAPYYDDVVLKQHEQELQLKENVAYGPIR